MYVSEPLQWVFGTILSVVPGVAQTSKCLVLLLTHFSSTEVPLCRFKLGFFTYRGNIFLYVHLYHNPSISQSQQL